MPMPVSETFISSNSILSLLFISNEISTLPFSGVNLKAFDKRFVIILLILSSSNSIYRLSQEEKKVICIFFFSEYSVKRLHTVCIKFMISPCDKFILLHFSSFFLKSRSWFTRFNSCMAFLCAILNLSFISLSEQFFITYSSGDRIRVSGVLKSWLMFVKKRSFISSTSC